MDLEHIAAGGAVDAAAIGAEPGPFSALAGCPQTAAHHGEGDVATHTAMVVDATEEILAGRGIGGHDAEVVRLAALLHDIGKPATTTEVAPCEWSAPRHAEAGARIVNTLYDTRADLSKRGRSEAAAVGAAVRAHMWAWHPEQVSVGAAVRTSHLVDLRLLAALWACDGAGRISVDAEQIPERVAWAELCLAELTRGETVGAYPHISEVCDPQQLEARVRRDVLRGVVTGTIASAGAAAAAIAHSERHQGPAHIVWMCGPPGAGKSTWAARYAERHDAEILTVTGARRRDRDQSRGHNRARLEQLVSAGARVVVDATHVTRESRDRLCALASRYGARLDAVIFDTRSQVCIQRQRHRPSGTAVPADTIRSMVAALRWPTPDEYDTLTVVADDGTEGPWLAQHELEDQEAHP